MSNRYFVLDFTSRVYLVLKFTCTSCNQTNKCVNVQKYLVTLCTRTHNIRISRVSHSIKHVKIGRSEIYKNNEKVKILNSIKND